MVLDVPILSRAFVRVDEYGKAWLTTEMLPGYLELFRQKVEVDRMKEDKIEVFRVRNERIRECLNLSLQAWQGILALGNNPLPEEVSFGIHVLANTLQVGSTEICGLGRGMFHTKDQKWEEGYRKVPWETDRHWRIAPDSFADRRMLEMGWCPSVVEQV